MGDSSEKTSDLGRAVREKARGLGFDAVGVAQADVALDEDFARYRAFVDAGMHAEMGWLAEYAELRERVDTSAILAGAKSVVCVARRYQRPAEEEATDPPFSRTIARYARGHDYHTVVRKKLRRLAVFLRTLGTAAAPVHARPICDDAPVLERAWASRAGLGFVGKNGLLIVPGQGSFVLLGEVVTTLALTPDQPIAERCGTCTRCLDACPTGAFPKPFVLDPRRCVSYLTIEHRSAIDEEARTAVGEHLFGCDDCQTVCPFNQSSRPRDPATTRTFAPHARWSETALPSLLTMDGPGWLALAEGTPLRRATADGLARNAAIVLGNRADRASLPALEVAAKTHRSEVVREAAGWAAAEIARKNPASGGETR